MNEPTQYCYEFGPFLLDPFKRRLFRDGKPISLTPKAFDTLLALVQNNGRIIEKDELMKEVWAGAVVEEGGLARNISSLRKALGETPGEHQYIATLPGRGYRFVASVRALPDEDARLTPEEEIGAPAISRRRGASRKVIVISVLAIGLIVTVLYALYTWTGRKSKQRDDAASVAPVRSVAVLPFRPLLADERDDYLGLGLTDVLITRLSSLRQVVVRPTSAVRKYVDPQQDPLVAGQELKVEAVLEGSIRRVDQRIRVTARLISVPDGRSLWADQFNAEAADLFTIEDSIAQKVAVALEPRLTGAEQRSLSKHYTASREAYQFYLKGRHSWYGWTGERARKSAEYFGQALKLDPDYALAHAGLARAYTQLGYFEEAPPKDVMPKAKAAAEKALRLDETLAEAYDALAAVSLRYEWNFAKAEREIRRAIELNPNYSEAHYLYSEYFIALGRFDEAIVEQRRAQELDPLTPLIVTTAGWIYSCLHNHDRAIEAFRKALELDPNFVKARYQLGWALYRKRLEQEAVAEFLRAETLAGAEPDSIVALRRAFGARGMRGYWRKELELAQEEAKRKRISPFVMARLYTELGDKNQAFAWLQQAYQERNGKLSFLKSLPGFESLRTDPRFADLVRLIGIPS